VFGQIGSLLGRVEFQPHASNVCRIDSCVKTHFGGRRSVGADSENPPRLRESPPHFPSHRATGNTEEFQNFRFSASQHFHSARSASPRLRESPPPVTLLFLLPSCPKIYSRIRAGRSRFLSTKEVEPWPRIREGKSP
jgi:hypothetical protein